MNWKMVVAVSLGLLIALVTWRAIGLAALRQSEAQAQAVEAKLRLSEVTAQAGQTKHEWEYKVVEFVVEDANPSADRQTKEVSKLAAEGWEYVGLLCAGPHGFLPQPGGQLSSSGNVLFKRPKR